MNLKLPLMRQQPHSTICSGAEARLGSGEPLAGTKFNSCIPFLSISKGYLSLLTVDQMRGYCPSRPTLTVTVH